MAKDFKFENFKTKEKDGKSYIYVKNVKAKIGPSGGKVDAYDTHIYISVNAEDYGTMYKAKDDNFTDFTGLASIEPEPDSNFDFPLSPYDKVDKDNAIKLPLDPKNDYKKVGAGFTTVDLSVLKKVLEDNKTAFDFFEKAPRKPKTFWDKFDLRAENTVKLINDVFEVGSPSNPEDFKAYKSVILKSDEKPEKYYLYNRDSHKLQECKLDTTKNPNKVKLEAGKFVDKDGKLGDGTGDKFDLLKSGVDLAKSLNSSFLAYQLMQLNGADFEGDFTVSSGAGTAKLSGKKGYVFKDNAEFYYFIFNDGKGVAKCGKKKPSADSLAEINLGTDDESAQLFNTKTYAFVSDKGANDPEVNSDDLVLFLKENLVDRALKGKKIIDSIESLKLEYVEMLKVEGGTGPLANTEGYIFKKSHSAEDISYYFLQAELNFLASCGKNKPTKENLAVLTLGDNLDSNLQYLQLDATFKAKEIKGGDIGNALTKSKLFKTAKLNYKISELNLTDGKKLTVAKDTSAGTAGLSEKSGYLFKGGEYYYFILDNGEGIVKCGKTKEPTADDLAKIKLGDGENDAQIFDIESRKFKKENKLEAQDVKATKDLIVVKNLLDAAKTKEDPTKENTPSVSGDSFPKTLKFKYGKDDVEVKFDKYGRMVDVKNNKQFVKYENGKLTSVANTKDATNVRDLKITGFDSSKLGLNDKLELANKDIKEAKIDLIDIRGNTKTIEISKGSTKGQLLFKEGSNEVKITNNEFVATGGANVIKSDLEVIIGTETKKLTEAIKSKINDENLLIKLGLKEPPQTDKFKFDGFEVATDPTQKDYLKVTLKCKENETSKSVVVWVDKNKKSYADDGNKPKSSEIKIKFDTKTGFSFGNDGQVILEFLKAHGVKEDNKLYKQINEFNGAAVENGIVWNKNGIKVDKNKPGFAEVELVIEKTKETAKIYVSYPDCKLFSELEGTGENTKGKTPINSINVKANKIDFTGGTNQISISDETKLVANLAFLKGLKKALEDVAFKPEFEYKLDDTNSTPEQLEKLKKANERVKVLMTATAAGLSTKKTLWVDVKGDVFAKEKDKNPLKQIVGFDGKDIQFASTGNNLKASSFNNKDLNEKFLNKEANYTLKHTLATVNDKNKKYAAKLTVQIMNGTTAITSTDAKKDFYVAKDKNNKVTVYSDEDLKKTVSKIELDGTKIKVGEVNATNKEMFDLKEDLFGSDESSKNVLKSLMKTEEQQKDEVKFEVLNANASKEIKFGTPEQKKKFFIVKAALANKVNKFFLIEEEYKKIYECAKEDGSDLDVNKPLIEFKLSNDKKNIEVKAATKADDEKVIVLKKGDAKVNKIPEALFNVLKGVDAFKKIFGEPVQDQKKVRFELVKDADNAKILKLGTAGQEKAYYLVKATLADNSTNKFFLIGKDDKKIYECGDDKGAGFDIKKPLTKFDVKEDGKSLDISAAQNEEEAKNAIIINKKEVNIPEDLKTALGALDEFKFFKPVEPPKNINLTFEIVDAKQEKIGEKEMEAYKIKMKVDGKDGKDFVIAKDGLLWSMDGKAKVHIGINGEIDNDSQSDAVHDEHLAGLLALILANDKDFFGEDVAKKQVLFNQSGTLIEDKIENIEIEVPDENGNNTKLSIGVPKTIVGVVLDKDKPDDIVYFDRDTLFITDKDGKVSGDNKKIYEHVGIKEERKDAETMIVKDSGGKAVSVNLAVSKADVILASQKIFGGGKDGNNPKFQEEQAMLINIVGKEGYDAISDKLMNLIAKRVAEGKLSKTCKPEDIEAVINEEISMNPWIKYGVSVVGGVTSVGIGATGILSIAGVLALTNPLVTIGLLVGSGVVGTGTLATCLINRYKARSNEKNLYHVKNKTEEGEKINPFKKIGKMFKGKEQKKGDESPAL